MSNIAETIDGNGYKEFKVRGDFLRLMGAAGKVELVYYKRGAEMTRSGSVGAGYAETFKADDFDSFRVYDRSGAANAVEIVYRLDSDVRYDTPPTGNVSVQGVVSVARTAQTRKAFTQAAPTVGAADQQIFAAKADRDYLLIQNTHASQNLFVTLDGVAATTANGIKIGPGGSLELSATVPTGAVRAIASGAGTTVIAVEA